MFFLTFYKRYPDMHRLTTLDLELRDFIVTPIVIFFVYALAYMIRPFVTDPVNRKYFLPGLTMRILCALAVGFLYQFYYEGGDTFAYHTHGSRPLWEAIMESPADGLWLLFQNGEYGAGIWKTASRVWYWNDPQSFFVIRLAAILDILTFSSYSATAVLFAVIAFSGGWMFFLTFYKRYPDMHRWIAFSVLFVPTVIFWGSGIFKDSITLAALGGCHVYFPSDIYREKIRDRICSPDGLKLLGHLFHQEIHSALFFTCRSFMVGGNPYVADFVANAQDYCCSPHGHVCDPAFILCGTESRRG